MEYFCISWKTKPHFNFKNSQAALKTTKLTLSASSFKASGLKGRLYHQNNNTRQKTKCTVFESQTDTVWKESSEDAEPKLAWTRTEKILLRLHGCHSELRLLSWLWRGLRIFLTSVYPWFSWRAEKDLSGATAAEEPRDSGVCTDVSPASWALIPSVWPHRRDGTCCCLHPS